jgi:putative FmdB family regulatory protein
VGDQPEREPSGHCQEHRQRHALETFQSIREPALRKCPKCGKSKLERLIGPGAGFLFKGGGFYQTDYRSESYKKAETAERDGAKPAAETKGGESKAGESKKEPAADATKTAPASKPGKASKPKSD